MIIENVKHYVIVVKENPTLLVHRVKHLQHYSISNALLSCCIWSDFTFSDLRKFLEYHKEMARHWEVREIEIGRVVTVDVES